MADPLPLSDLLCADDARWPRHHERSLREALDCMKPGERWALVPCWRSELPVGSNWSQVDAVREGLNRSPSVLPPVGVQVLIAHFHAGVGRRTRFEPWVFLFGDVKLALCASMLVLLHQDLAFWGDDSALHAVTRREARNLGIFKAGSIASEIRESSPLGMSFLGFDGPATTPLLAMARAAYVGAAK